MILSPPAFPFDVFGDEVDGIGCSRRRVRLEPRAARLWGRGLQPGDAPSGVFRLPPARGAREPLCGERLGAGLALVSTLPDVGDPACVARIERLDALTRRRFPQARIHHVSLDAPDAWSALGPAPFEARTGGYSLAGADEASARTFCWLFGVGVEGSSRVAHGLFVLLDGVVLSAEVSTEQPDPADAERALRRIEHLAAVLDGGRLASFAGGPL